MEIIVIGAGASGMMAALSASENSRNHVILLERQARPARKLLATGNGRCNLTNLDMHSQYFHTETPELLYALRAFNEKQTLSWFSRLGLVTVAEETGRVYPFSDSANSVVDVLRFALDQAGVELLCGEEVSTITRAKKGFTVQTNSGSRHADKLILACGGQAGGKLGGTKDGIGFLRSLGHSVTPVTPSLVQLKTDDRWVKSLKGVRTDADVTLVSATNVLAQTSGEVQFTEYGVSGPAIFEVSREAARNIGSSTLVLDLMPLMDQAALEALLYERVNRFDQLTLENLLTGVLHNRLGRTVIRYAGLDLAVPLSNVTDADIGRIASAVKSFCLPVTGTMGFDAAQVSAGGACGDQFDPETLESRLVPGLYACGEVLDVDGDCGGYNLQWAWSSGRLAGQLKHKEVTE